MGTEQFKEISESLQEGPDIAEQLAEMIDLMKLLQQATAIQKADAIQFAGLACNVATRLQKQTLDAQQQTLDYCTAYKEQVSILQKNNHNLATIIFQQTVSAFHFEGNA
jgi:hypothetical protein